MRRKVSGERIAAAIIDAIILSVVALIPMVVLGIVYGFEGILENVLFQENPLEPSNEYITFVMVTVISETLLGVIYFSFIPYKWNGQTLGKKMLSIKAINEFGENPSFMQHLIRAIQNWGGYVMLPLSFLVFFNYLAYIFISAFIGIIPTILLFVSLIMLLAREDGKGLHDLWAGTNVVRVTDDINQELNQKTTQMSEWATVVDPDDKGIKDKGIEEEIKKDDDSWYE